MEHWSARVEKNEGVGIWLKCEVDMRLFRRYVRNAEQRRLTKCLML